MYKPIPPLTPAQVDRFWSKVDASGDCWEWTAYRDECGYGRVGLNKKVYVVHRVAFALLLSEDVPSGMEIDHLCFNRPCVNPDHLRIVTPFENRSGRRLGSSPNRERTHCRHGHEFTPENTYRQGRWRMCKQCVLDRNRTPQARTRKNAWQRERRAAGL